jgi:protein TonB
MRQDQFSVPGFKVTRQRGAPAVSRRRAFLLIAVALSVGVHIAAALLILFLPRVLPKEARPQEQGTVELLMVEQKGAKPDHPGQPDKDHPAPPEKAAPPTAAAQPAAPTTPAPPTPAPPKAADKATAAPKVAAEQPKPPTSPDLPMPPGGDEPAPPPTDQPSPKPRVADNPQPPKQAETPPPQPPQQAEAQPRPPPPQEAPVFNLEGTDSESNAVALGGHIVPAMPDDRFRNRPPIYPADAEMRGEHGAVEVLIHVSENGLATGAEILQSSGVASLDQAAVAAVRKWHFRPAIKGGRSIPFDMPFRFVFEDE